MISKTHLKVEAIKFLTQDFFEKNCWIALKIVALKFLDQYKRTNGLHWKLKIWIWIFLKRTGELHCRYELRNHYW